MATEKKLSYERITRNFDLQPNLRKDTEPSKTIASTPIVSSPALKGYEKTEGTFSYSIVCIISGGERKERDFLRELIRQKELHSLRVAFLSKKGQGLQPYQMQDKWSEIQSSGEFDIDGNRFCLDAMDKVFLLSDVDEFYDQLVKIVNTHAVPNAGEWIISNPCFEIWLYYCFNNQPREELATIEPLTADKRSQGMKHLGNSLVPGGLNPLVAFENMGIGIKNSLVHYAEDEQSIPVLYATQMYRMAQYLMETMNRNKNEYDEFVRKKRAWRELMRQNR